MTNDKKYERSEISKLPDSTGKILADYVANKLILATDSNIVLAIKKLDKDTIKSIIGIAG